MLTLRSLVSVGIRSGKVEGERRKRRKHSGETMTFPTLHLSGRDTCCPAVMPLPVAEKGNTVIWWYKKKIKNRYHKESQGTNRLERGDCFSDFIVPVEPALLTRETEEREEPTLLLSLKSLKMQMGQDVRQKLERHIRGKHV